MAKRFTDTGIWAKRWFRELAPKEKCFVKFLYDQCTLAGIWEVDFGQASFFIGEEVSEEIKDKIPFEILVFDDETKWFVKDFIPFQYGEELKPSSPIHKKIIGILQGYSINGHTLYDTLSIGYTIPCKKKNKKKEEEEEEEEERGPEVKLFIHELAEFFGLDPNRRGYKELDTCVNHLAYFGKFDEFKTQSEGYMKYKTESGQTVHGWKAYIGTQEEDYEDGAWNGADYYKLLKNLNNGNNSKDTTESNYGKL